MVQAFHFLKLASRRVNSGEPIGSGRLQGFANILRLDGPGLPERRDVAADHAAVPQIDQALEHGQGRCRGHGGQFGLRRRDIDRRTGHGKLAHLGREFSA